MTKLRHVKAIQNGDFTGLPISGDSTAVNLTGSWKFFRPHLVTKESPCRQACPLNIPIAAYLDKLASGNISEALHLLREYNPMPAITGRVCPHFCQSACNRQEFDEAVLIGDLERYLGDLGLESPHSASTEKRAEKVAIIGAGPAGLSAAVFLARKGLKTTIFEQAPLAGGLLRYAIPAYRLPREILDRELDNLLNNYDIDLKCNHRIESSELAQLEKKYQHIIWAPGLQRSSRPAPWHDIPQVKGALELLAAINRGEAIKGRRFIVIGGGNAALDTARSLLRLGKKVEIVYRRTIAEMPAYEEEKKQALDEGLVIHEKQVVGTIAAGETLQINLHQGQDNDGRISEGDFLKKVEADYLIAAIGQESDLNLNDFSLNDHNLIIKAGDFSHGAASVAEALASGRQAAETILRKLVITSSLNANTESKKPIIVENSSLHLDYYSKIPAINVPELDNQIRTDNFSEIRQSLTQEQMKSEIERCFHCGSCTACGICWFFCPDVAIAINREESDPDKRVLFDYDHCKGCGQCTVVCPRGVIEMEEDH
ncbi:MAG: FAD-dependent oxidoreductase [Pseudomonadota bacterium]|nr:FAD-dependent oxidoreductase [Pseudomonadota bacterium]